MALNFLPPSVIVFGGQATGKTTNAEKIAEKYGLKLIVDNFNYGTVIPFGVLYLSQQKANPVLKNIPIAEALKWVTLTKIGYASFAVILWTTSNEFMEKKPSALGV